MPEIAYVDGVLTPIDRAMVPVEDRGLQFGEAVYEVIAGYDGRLFCLEEHLDRLGRSMEALDFPYLSRDEIRSTIQTVYERSALPRAAVYIQVSRGDAPRQHAIPAQSRLRIILTAREIHPLAAKLRQTGASLITVADTRWGRCDIKTVQLLANVLAKKEAMERGAFDALFIAPDGVVREATSANLFVVTGGRLQTHPLNERILGGVTRRVVMRLCREQKLPVWECFMQKDEIWQAEEVFISGTLTRILPVTAVDRRPVGSGKPGPITQRLAQALKEKMQAG